MEEILASIRRILNEDEPAEGADGHPSEEAPPDDDVLVLDRSMLISVPDPDPASSDATASQPVRLAADVAEADRSEPEQMEAEGEEADPVATDQAVPDRPATEPVEDHIDAIAEPVAPSGYQAISEVIPTEASVDPASGDGVEAVAAPLPRDASSLSDQALVGAATAAATASSVDGLVRALAASKAARVFHGGPTIEDLVREELRVLLKGWLEDNLPQLVERLVRAEIEKLVGRSVP